MHYNMMDGDNLRIEVDDQLDDQLVSTEYADAAPVDNSPIGERLNTIFELRALKAEHEAEVKKINARISAIEYGVILDMEEQQFDKLSCSGGTVSKNVALYPKVEDKETFFRWCVENDHLDMLQGQANKAVFKEFFESEGYYPDGLDAFQKTGLNYRKAR